MLPRSSSLGVLGPRREEEVGGFQRVEQHPTGGREPLPAGLVYVGDGAAQRPSRDPHELFWAVFFFCLRRLLHLRMLKHASTTVGV